MLRTSKQSQMPHEWDLFCGCAQVFEEGSPVKANPLAWWEFKDCMDYLERHGLERHPLHDQVWLNFLFGGQLSLEVLQA